MRRLSFSPGFRSKRLLQTSGRRARRNQFSQCGRRLEDHAYRLAFACHRRNRGGGVNVPGHDVPAKLIAHAQWPFEIDTLTNLPCAGCRFRPGFVRSDYFKPAVAELGAINFPNADGASKIMRTDSPSLATDATEAVASTCPVTMCPPSSSPTRSGRSRLIP